MEELNFEQYQLSVTFFSGLPVPGGELPRRAGDGDKDSGTTLMVLQ